ncbi:hypothetical protein [uncultured Nocardioides sp.]|jgi:uncharacterized protein YggE|uniref:hypothetical protein n=1 Tax=uncultured Nocardioides sp. TaxID=198441 RepID=UPI0023B4B368
MMKHVLTGSALAALVSLSACSTGATDPAPTDTTDAAEAADKDGDQKAIEVATSGRAAAAADMRTVAGQVEADMWNGDGYSTNAEDMRQSIDSAAIDEDARVRSFDIDDESFQLCLVNDTDGVWAYLDSTDDVIETGEGESCP